MNDRREYLYTLEEYYSKFGRRSNKCHHCAKHYKLPSFIYEPRDKICFTCESRSYVSKELTRYLNRYNIN